MTKTKQVFVYLRYDMTSQISLDLTSEIVEICAYEYISGINLFLSLFLSKYNFTDEMEFK
jgi:hypothetical protein